MRTNEPKLRKIEYKQFLINQLEQIEDEIKKRDYDDDLDEQMKLWSLRGFIKTKLEVENVLG